MSTKRCLALLPGVRTMVQQALEALLGPAANRAVLAGMPALHTVLRWGGGNDAAVPYEPGRDGILALLRPDDPGFRAAPGFGECGPVDLRDSRAIWIIGANTGRVIHYGSMNLRFGSACIAVHDRYATKLNSPCSETILPVSVEGSLDDQALEERIRQVNQALSEAWQTPCVSWKVPEVSFSVPAVAIEEPAPEGSDDAIHQVLLSPSCRPHLAQDPAVFLPEDPLPQLIPRIPLKLNYKPGKDLSSFP